MATQPHNEIQVSSPVLLSKRFKESLRSSHIVIVLIYPEDAEYKNLIICNEHVHLACDFTVPENTLSFIDIVLREEFDLQRPARVLRSDTATDGIIPEALKEILAHKIAAHRSQIKRESAQ